MTAVADAIRSKTGGSDPLSFPTGFSDAITGISGGDGIDVDKVAPFIYGWVRQSYEYDKPMVLTEETVDAMVALTGVPSGYYIFHDFSGEASDGSITSPLGRQTPYSRIELDTSSGSMMDGAEGLFAKVSTYGYIRDWSQSTIVAKELVEGTVEFTKNDPEGNVVLKYGTFAGATLVSFPEVDPAAVVLDKYCFHECRFRDTVDLTGLTRVMLNSYALYNITSIRYEVDDSGVVTTTYGPATLKLGVLPVFSDNYTPYIAGTADYPLIIELTDPVPPTLNTTNAMMKAWIQKIIVPAGSLSAYQSATNWSTYADIMEEASA